GRAAVRFKHVMADDFAFDVQGNLYVAANAQNRLLRLRPDGRMTTLATKATDGLDNPSAVAFGMQGRRTTLYITNAAYFSPHPRPSLQRLDAGVAGASFP